MCVTGRAGLTASVNCSLCQAGTYGTGSGEGLRLKSLWPRKKLSSSCLLQEFLLVLVYCALGDLMGRQVFSVYI